MNIQKIPRVLRRIPPELVVVRNELGDYSANFPNRPRFAPMRFRKRVDVVRQVRSARKRVAARLLLVHSHEELVRKFARIIWTHRCPDLLWPLSPYLGPYFRPLSRSTVAPI